jgi:hypothetical protein
LTIFYSVVEGDPLDSGGSSAVIEGLADCTIEGEDGRHRKQAFLGHKAWCDRCKSAGVIVAAAGCATNLRMFDRTIGQHEAVGGDEIMCKCPTAPRIIAVHGRNCMIIDGGGKINNTAASTSLQETPPGLRNFDEQVRAIARIGAMEGYPYFVETAGGRTYNGYTDKNGHLPRITTGDDESYTVYWGDDALAKQQEN